MPPPARRWIDPSSRRSKRALSAALYDPDANVRFWPKADLCLRRTDMPKVRTARATINGAHGFERTRNAAAWLTLAPPKPGRAQARARPDLACRTRKLQL